MKALDARHYLIEARLDESMPGPEAGFPFDLPAVRNLDVIEFHPAVTFLVGENGSGKSTLVEALAGAAGFNPEGGTRNFRFSTRASHSELHKYLRVVKGVKQPRSGFFMRAESFYNVATEVDRLGVGEYYGGRSLHEQSHGESFLALFMHRFIGNSLYLLDEPEAALSPSRQMAVLRRMHDLVTEGAQFIIATHSPVLLAYPAALILSLEEQQMREVKYEETEHFFLMKRFLNDHSGMVEKLLRGGE